ncbi:MAG: bile acid:sodium symporter family protein [Cyclobacteriaceae bacterium]|jgi:BASS family bile acid:Na+ symporter|nr:bile acid:sodium symporter family protein [Cyclobacteriaceae bacterium]
MEELDAVRLNFSSDSLWVLNVVLAILLFGVALELKTADFKRLADNPRASLIGIACQFLLLPAITFGLVWAVRPHPSIALGMMLVAACPGGNISNFLTHFARGNTALSVSLTAIGTVLAIVATPLNLAVWAGWYPPTSGLLRHISLDPWNMIQTIVTLAGLPLALGMLVAHYTPALAKKLTVYVKPLSILVFVAFVLLAFGNNVDHFQRHIHRVAVLVFVHNALALLTGFWAARWGGLSLTDQKTIALETGIQNSGLGLILIFRFFDGMGGMALVAAWWGIWHIVSGLALAYYWSRGHATQPVS